VRIRKKSSRWIKTATIIDSRKREALYTYEGSRATTDAGVWAEMDVVLADEFRTGMCGGRWLRLTVAQAAFAAALKRYELLLSGRLRLPREKVVALAVETRNAKVGRPDFICLAVSARMRCALHSRFWTYRSSIDAYGSSGTPNAKRNHSSAR